MGAASYDEWSWLDQHQKWDEDDRLGWMHLDGPPPHKDPMTTDPESCADHRIPCCTAEQDLQNQEQMQMHNDHINDDYEIVEPLASWSSTHKHDESNDKGLLHSMMQKMH